MLKLDTLSQRFENFSKLECSDSSNLYEFLSLKTEISAETDGHGRWFTWKL